MKNDLLLRVLQGEKTERPPVWLMRQAGRILPQYRALRASLSGFKELVSTPDLAAEVTIQPVDELGVDAAIIFSDILVIPECMGLDYEMVEKRGPHFPETIKTNADVEKLLSGVDAAEKLEYVFDAVKETKIRLNNRVPLIGFSGAPWTLMAYMIEGGGSKTFSKAKAMLYRDPALAKALLDKLTDTIIEYIKLKIEAGVDVVQIFDSWAGMLDRSIYEEFMIPSLQKIRSAITEVPVIIFSKGAWFSLDQIAKIKPNAIGLDWNITPKHARSIIGAEQVVQGNMDPCVLYGSHQSIENTAHNMMNAMGPHHIVNLGHGVYPDTPLDGVKAFVNSIKSFKY